MAKKRDIVIVSSRGPEHGTNFCNCWSKEYIGVPNSLVALTLTDIEKHRRKPEEIIIQTHPSDKGVLQGYTRTKKRWGDYCTNEFFQVKLGTHGEIEAIVNTRDPEKFAGSVIRNLPEAPFNESYTITDLESRVPSSPWNVGQLNEYGKILQGSFLVERDPNRELIFDEKERDVTMLGVSSRMFEAFRDAELEDRNNEKKAMIILYLNQQGNFTVKANPGRAFTMAAGRVYVNGDVQVQYIGLDQNEEYPHWQFDNIQKSVHDLFNISST